MTKIINKAGSVFFLLLLLCVLTPRFCMGQNRLAILRDTYSNHSHGQAPAIMEMTNKNILVIGGRDGEILITEVDTNLCIKASTRYVLSLVPGLSPYFNSQNTIQTPDGGWLLLASHLLFKVSSVGVLQWCKYIQNDNWRPNIAINPATGDIWYLSSTGLPYNIAYPGAPINLSSYATFAPCMIPIPPPPVCSSLPYFGCDLYNSNCYIKNSTIKCPLIQVYDNSGTLINSKVAKFGYTSYNILTQGGNDYEKPAFKNLYDPATNTNKFFIAFKRPNYILPSYNLVYNPAQQIYTAGVSLYNDGQPHNGLFFDVSPSFVTSAVLNIQNFYSTDQHGKLAIEFINPGTGILSYPYREFTQPNPLQKIGLIKFNTNTLSFLFGATFSSFSPPLSFVNNNYNNTLVIKNNTLFWSYGYNAMFQINPASLSLIKLKKLSLPVITPPYTPGYPMFVKNNSNTLIASASHNVLIDKSLLYRVNSVDIDGFCFTDPVTATVTASLPGVGPGPTITWSSYTTTALSSVSFTPEPYYPTSEKICGNTCCNKDTTISVTICVGSNYTLPDGVVINVAGDYESIIPSSEGCDSVILVHVTENPLPTVFFIPPSSCINGAAVDLNIASTVNPTGGTFSGPGITGSIFDPAAAGAGTPTITYFYTDGNGCTNSAANTITVYALPTVTCPGNSSACINTAPYTLSGSLPSGGIYSGTGVSSGMFDPGAAGTGSHIITYTYTDANGCTNNCLFTITVNQLPTVNFTPPSTYCINDPAINLNIPSIVSPAGGIFSGPGVSGTMFNPAVAGAGVHTINYSYTDPVTNCSADASAIIVLNPLPAISFSPPVSFCINTPALDLHVPGIVNPLGGNFTGPGIIGNAFDPATAGPGTHSITYSYTSPTTGCTSSATTIITVYPTVTETEYINLCHGQAYTLPSGVVINTPGTYISNVFTAEGCDRTVTTIATCCNCVGSSWGAVNYITYVPALATTPLILTCKAGVKPDSYSLKCNVPVTLNAIYNCSSVSCSIVKVIITPPSGPASTYTLPYIFTPTMTGTYSVTYLAYCGTTLCKTCYVRFSVKCPPTHVLPGIKIRIFPKRDKSNDGKGG